MHALEIDENSAIRTNRLAIVYISYIATLIEVSVAAMLLFRSGWTFPPGTNPGFVTDMMGDTIVLDGINYGRPLLRCGQITPVDDDESSKTYKNY